MYFSIMFLENGNLIIQSQVLRLEREKSVDKFCINCGGEL